MRVRNIHERLLPTGAERVGALLEGLGSAYDALWPADRWPPLRLDRPLGPGAEGGHGPVRYRVAAHEPGRRVEFRFLAPRGFDGMHAFEVLPEAGGARLRHRLEMVARGPALLSWPLVYRPLHDALIEDALARAAAALGFSATPPAPWTRQVRALRAVFRLLARGGGARRTRSGTGPFRHPGEPDVGAG